MNSRLLDVLNSLPVGKNAGNFADSAVFCETSVSKTSANSAFCKRIPYADEQGIISRPQGIFGREQGIWRKSKFAKGISVADKKIIN